MPPSRTLPALFLLLAITALALPRTNGALAQEGFNPFVTPEAPSRPARKEPEQPQAAGPYLVPMDGTPRGEGDPQAAPAAVIREEMPAPIPEKGQAVERADLAPVMAEDGSGLPYELWRGLSLAEVEALIASLDIPPKSVALHALWRRLITSAVGAPGGADASRFTALRVEALDRSGLLDEAADLLAKESPGRADPVIAALTARSEAGAGNRDRACEIAKSLVAGKADLPPRLKGEIVLIAGYCSLAAGDTTAAELGAEVARELLDDELAGPDVLAAAAAGAAPAIVPGRRIGLIDVRILELKGGVDAALLRGGATPAALSALARAPTTAPALRLAAGEAAAAVNAITPADLAAVYRAQAVSPGTPASADTAPGVDAEARRAALFKAAETERTPLRKARLIRAFLDTARHAGLYWPALDLMAGPAQQLSPSPRSAGLPRRRSKRTSPSETSSGPARGLPLLRAKATRTAWDAFPIGSRSPTSPTRQRRRVSAPPTSPRSRGWPSTAGSTPLSSTGSRPCSTRSTSACRSRSGTPRTVPRNPPAGICRTPACSPIFSRRRRRRNSGARFCSPWRRSGPTAPRAPTSSRSAIRSVRCAAPASRPTRDGSASRHYLRPGRAPSATDPHEQDDRPSVSTHVALLPSPSRGGGRCWRNLCFTAMTSIEEPLIAAFLEMLASEHGAADNTLEAYRRDLADFARFAADRGVAVAAVRPADVSGYMQRLSEEGLSAASRARRLSAIRQLYRFLEAEGAVPRSPAAGTPAPGKGRPLPKTLSVAEVDRLIETASRAAIGLTGRELVARGAPLLPPGDALCDRHARQRARRAAALGPPRRPARARRSRARAGASASCR